VSDDAENIWTRVRADLALTVGEETYRIWLEPLRAVELRGNSLLVEAPAQAHRWIHDRFGRVLTDSVRRVLDDGACVEIIAAEGPAQLARGAPERAPRRGGPGAGRERAAAPAPHEAGEAGPLGNPKLTFDQFVIGDSNRLAHAAALSVAEMPAQTYNPLFICGPPGVGKTHLLSSIANLLLSHSPGLTVRLTTGEAFTNAFHVDVLLMDDVQFLERKTRTEEEFFHTFNALYDGGRQIVVTSDRPPADLQALEDRLRERFQAGLVADIRAPDPATRMAILRKRASHDGIALVDEEPLALIAERVQSNVRALEGALIRVVAFSSLTGRALSAELTREVLDGLYPKAAGAGQARTIEEIQAVACAHFGLSAQELLSSTRSARVAWPRQLAMFLSRELTGESLPAIGRSFGGRDHTTVLHACRRASARLDSDADARAAVEKLCGKLGSRTP
jgi:chromosomal replication initiator protein